MIGPQLPCSTACTTELTATNATARPAIRYSHRFMTSLRSCQACLSRQASLTPELLSSELVTGLPPRPVLSRQSVWASALKASLGAFDLLEPSLGSYGIRARPG